MGDRPLIMSVPMVRAILREVEAPGTGKTQTRLLIRDAVPEPPAMDNVHPSNVVRHERPYLDAYCGGPRTTENPRGMGPWWCWWTRDDRACPQFKVGIVPGDRFWVRERFIPDPSADDDAWDDNRMSFFEWNGCGSPLSGIPASLRKPSSCLYVADERWSKYQDWLWTSGAKMPRWASRLTLHVASVWVQRLQDISEEDARAEGAPAWTGALQSYRTGFYGTWNGLHGVGAWEANPFVAAITFRPVLANIDDQATRGGNERTPSPDNRSDTGLDHCVGEGS